MALFFAPVANVVLSSVRREEEGQASGANNAIRELGGVFGVAVLASVFAHYGGYRTGATFAHGMTLARLRRRGGRRARLARGVRIGASGEAGAETASATGRRARTGLNERVTSHEPGSAERDPARPCPSRGLGTARIALDAIWPPSRAVTSTFTFQPSRSDSSRASAAAARSISLHVSARRQGASATPTRIRGRVAIRRSS